MGFFQKAKGILGINARNHLYISKYNTRMHKRLADDKIFTKHFLESRGFGVAKLYRVVESFEDLRSLSAKDLPESFVIKPNHGYGGQGIIVIREKDEASFVGVSGKKYTFEELFLHCNSILEGKYSISGLRDKVIVEERLEPHEMFSEFTTIGLPDIRVIVFNLVPVIAMLRVPTIESEGKANVHLGAIGIGIDIGSGRTTGGVQRNEKIHVFPNGKPVKNIQLSFWDEILFSASKIQQCTKIGFMAVDFVITKSGVKVLEVNARAGLMVQIANQIPLRKRLEKVQDVKVTSPEKGVEVAEALFSEKTLPDEKRELLERPVIGLIEPATFLGKKNTAVLAKIDTDGTENFIEESLFQENELTADVLIAEKRLRLPFRARSFHGEEFQMIIAAKYLKDFLIDPSRNVTKKIERHTRHGEEKLIKNIDRKLSEIDSQINLLSFFKPVNLEEQKEIFLSNPRESPQFYYRTPKVALEELLQKLSKIPNECDHPLMPLYSKKREEIEMKIHLIQAINTPAIQEISERLWGEVDEAIYSRALAYLKTIPHEEDRSKRMSFSDVVSSAEKYLKKNGLSHWAVKILDSTIADFQVTKQNTLFIKKDVEVSENRFQSLLAHEVDTHIFRLENGRTSGYFLFERGTAGYLRTEEGLAVYNQNQLKSPVGEKRSWGAYRVISAYLGKKMSFLDLYHYLRSTFGISEDSAWRSCIKAKRGLRDTSLRAAFTKDSIYFSGREDVEKFLGEDPEGIKKLYIGKIAIEDLWIMDKIKDKLWEPKHLPSQYKPRSFR